MAKTFGKLNMFNVYFANATADFAFERRVGMVFEEFRVLRSSKLLLLFYDGFCKQKCVFQEYARWES